MTTELPRHAQLLLLDQPQVSALLQPDEVLAAVREAFVLHSTGEGQVFPVVREALATGGVFGIKSGTVPGQELLGFKAAGFWPGNRQLAAEPHQATILLIDPATGRPLCMIDGNAVTTQRTGAAGGLGLLALCRADSRRITVFGTGVQARVQLSFALRLLPELQQVHYLSSGGRPRPDFEAAITKAFPACVIAHTTDGDAAVADSDVVITATPGTGALFALEAVQPGTHLSCVGADTRGKRELPAGLLARARLFVDDLPQARQIGEMQWAPDTPATTLGDVITAQVQVHRDTADITVFDMTGLALQDLTVARLLYQRALATGAGTRLAWPW
jgi:ornithine cyclodeaminase